MAAGKNRRSDWQPESKFDNESHGSDIPSLVVVSTSQERETFVASYSSLVRRLSQ